MTSLKLKTFVLQKILLRKRKDKPHTGERIVANHVSNIGFVSSVYKEHLKIIQRQNLN